MNVLRPGPGDVRYRDPPLFATALFLAFVAARYMQWGARSPGLAAIRIEFALGLPLLAVCIGVAAAQPPRLRDVGGVLGAIAALFAAMLFQLPFAADQLAAHDVFVDRVIKFALMTVFMVVLIRSPRTMGLFIFAFLVSCLYITQESVRGLISGGLVWENQGVLRLHGAVPIYRHPNSLGGLAMGTIPYCVFLLPIWKAWYLRAGLLALLVTALVCVLYTGSRTAYVAFLAFLIYWWGTSRRKSRWMLYATLAGFAVLLVIPQQYKERFLSIGGQEAEGRSKETRIQILRDAWEIFVDNPGGVGVASFPAVRRERFGRIQDTHNLYLEIGTNLGVQGLVVFIILISVIMRALRRAYRDCERQLARLRSLAGKAGSGPLIRRAGALEADIGFLRAVALATAGFIFVRLWLGLFGMDLYEVYWWFAAGLAITLVQTARVTGAVLAQLEQATAEATA